MQPFTTEYQKIIFALEGAVEQIKAINNPEVSLLTTGLITDINRHVNSLKLRIGIEPDSHKEPANALPPLRKVMGRIVTDDNGAPIAVNRAVPETAREVELTEMRMKVDEIYLRFLSTPSDQLMDTLSDIEIRGVAKKAGLPVSDKLPKRIDVGYIDQVKKAIQLQIDKGTNSPSLSSNDTDDETDNPPLFSGDPLDSLTDPANQITSDIEGDDNDIMLMEQFSQKTNASILDDYSEAQIREMAKKAGLPVSDKSPDKIDSKFITHLKSAIQKQLKES